MPDMSVLSRNGDKEHKAQTTLKKNENTGNDKKKSETKKNKKETTECDENIYTHDCRATAFTSGPSASRLQQEKDGAYFGQTGDRLEQNEVDTLRPGQHL